MLKMPTSRSLTRSKYSIKEIISSGYTAKFQFGWAFNSLWSIIQSDVSTVWFDLITLSQIRARLYAPLSLFRVGLCALTKMYIKNTIINFFGD